MTDRSKIECILMTGLSGSGKTTLANELCFFLKANDRPCVVLDGDVLRDGLNSDLKFSREDRRENARRIAEVANLFISEGIIPIISIIAPYQEDRIMMRDIIASPDFFLVFINCPLEICKLRDVKGLYAKVRDGAISDFTGVSSAYEVPQYVNLAVDTHIFGIKDSMEMILKIAFPNLIEKLNHKFENYEDTSRL